MTRDDVISYFEAVKPGDNLYFDSIFRFVNNVELFKELPELARKRYVGDIYFMDVGFKLDPSSPATLTGWAITLTYLQKHGDDYIHYRMGLT